MAGDLDPRLLTVRNKPTGFTGFFSSLFSRNQTPTVRLHVKLSDTDQFESHPGVELRSVAGPDADGHYLATASISADRLSTVLASPEVIAAEAPSRLSPQLQWAVPNMRARPQDFPQTLGDKGTGVVIGIIDAEGLDYRLRSFRNGNTSRVELVWAINGNLEFTRAQIEQSLTTGTFLSNYPLKTGSTNRDSIDSHGTAVADCAAGCDPFNPGVASNADIIFVELANLFPWQQAPGTFAESTELVDAADYIFRKAGARPCVINISQGTIEGPSNGLALASQHFELLLAAQPNRAVVTCAGNFGGDLLHGSIAVGPTQTRTATFRTWPKINPNGYDVWHELNAWYSPQASLSFRLTGPTARYGPFPLGTGTNQIKVGSTLIMEWAHLDRPTLQQKQLYVRLSDAAPTGTWTLEITNSAAAGAAEDVHLYLMGPANADDPSFEGDAASRSHTLVSLACSENVIAVGAHDGVPGGEDRVTIFSSLGPTRGTAQKPDLTAPGQSVRVAQPGGKYCRSQGTSFSSPLAAGVAALCLAEAHARNGSLTAADLRQILIDTASQSAVPRAWSPSRGWGAVDASAALAEVARRFPHQ